MGRTLAVALMLSFAVGARGQGPDGAPAPAPTPDHVVKGFTLPAPVQIDNSEGYTHIIPQWDDDGKPIQVEWAVTTTGEVAPKFTDLGTAGLIVAVPQPGEQTLIHAAALIQPDDPAGKPWLTRIAQTTVTAAARAPVAASAVRPATGAAAIVVFDSKTASQPFADAIRSPRLRDELTKINVKLFAYDITSPVLTERKYRPVVERAGVLPVVMVVSPDGHQLLTDRRAVPLPVSGDSRSIENSLMDIVGQAIR